jgi:hypothetical protein
MNTHKGEKYYTRPYVLWALLTSAIVIVSLGGLVYDAIQGHALGETLINRGLVASTCIMLSFSLSALVSWFLPICLSKEGIRSYTVFGVYRSVEWAQIARIEAVSVVGIRYARVYLEEGGSPIWIPEFLKNRDAFLAQLRQRTPHAGAVEEAFTGAVDHSGFVSTRPVEAGS